MVLPPKGWRKAGEGCAPPVSSWPPGTRSTRPPPRDLREAAPGDGGGTAENPPSPAPLSPPRPVDGWRPAREAAAPQPPREGRSTRGGGRHSRGERSRAPSAPSRPHTHSRSARCRPAALRRRSMAFSGPQRNGDAQECSMEDGAHTKRPVLVPARGRRGNRPRQRDLPAPRPAGPPERAPGGTAQWHPSPPPRQADPLTAGQAAHGAWGCPATPAEHIYPGGVRRRRQGTGPGATGHPPRAGGWRTTLRSPLSSPPHSRLRPAGRGAAGPPSPPRQRGRPPSPQRGRGTREGTQLSPHTARPHAPHRLLPRGAQQAGEPAPAHKDDTRTGPGGCT